MTTTRYAIATLLFVLLGGCGPIQVHPSTGRSFTLEHGTERFQDAMQGAQAHCAGMGMTARHLGTDRGGALLLSRFECAPR